MTNGKRLKAIQAVADEVNQDISGALVTPAIVEAVLLGDRCESHPVIERIRVELKRGGLL